MIVLLAMMASISVGLRLIPFVFSKWLSRWTALEKLSASLPICISILLVAYFLEQTPYRMYPFAIPELAGLCAVVCVQLWMRKLLLSIGTGVCVHQMILHCL